jgi:hypothetical protein
LNSIRRKAKELATLPMQRILQDFLRRQFLGD